MGERMKVWADTCFSASRVAPPRVERQVALDLGGPLHEGEADGARGAAGNDQGEADGERQRRYICGASGGGNGMGGGGRTPCERIRISNLR